MMGSRFQGGVARGAMPWKNRWISNPALTGLLNLFFATGIDYAQYRLRAIREDVLLGLDSHGMEFASEMAVKASLHRHVFGQVPATRSPDLRNRGPHLWPWRNGWRHPRYLLTMSVTWASDVPALASMAAALLVLSFALAHQSALVGGHGPFGTSWAIVAGFLLTCGPGTGVIAVTMLLHSVREDHRSLTSRVARFARHARLETLLLAGAGRIGMALALGGWPRPRSARSDRR